MIHATYQMAKIRQYQALQDAAQPSSTSKQRDLRDTLGALLISAGQRLQSRPQYHTVLHAG